MRLSELGAANDVLDDPAALARRYRDDGCLLVRGLLDPASAGDLAEEATAVLRRLDVAGPRGAGSSPRWTGRPAGCRYLSDVDTVAALARLVDGFADPGAVPKNLIDQVCGHAMHVWRNACFFVSVPDDPAYVTKPHQDGYAMNATGDYRRVWVAVTHIPFGDGGLAVALGSHRAGRLPQRAFPQYRVRPTRDEPEPAAVVHGVDPDLVGDHWHTTEFHPGDALIFHTDLVHRGLPSASDRIRLALAMITSAETDPRPAVTYTKPEMRERRRMLGELGARLGLTPEQVRAVSVDLIMTGLPVTEATLRAALAGEHARWRDQAPAQLANRS